ncbi:MAG: NAD-dependent epimerase/dehydratase family protein [Elusimicrobiota bacterium]
MIVAVTGAAGMVGSSACAALTAAGHAVRRLTRSPSGADDRLFRLEEPLSPGALAGCDALIHGAYDFSAMGWEQVEHVNVQGSLRLLNASKRAGIKRVVFVSSISAFAACRSDYGRGKVIVENAALDGDAIVLRPGLIYGGPGGMYKALAKLSACPLLPVFDGGGQPLHMVHLDDVARDLVAALHWDPKRAAGPVTLADPEPIAFKDLLAAIARDKGRRVRTVSIPSAPVLLFLRALEALGLRPRFRADSLEALLHPNDRLDWSAHGRLNLNYRRFGRTSASDEQHRKLLQ